MMQEKLVRLLGAVSCNGNGESLGSCPDRKYGLCREAANLSYCVIQNIANHLIANGVAVQEWILVKDRLPSKEEYIARTEDGTEYYVRLLVAYKTDIVEYEIGYYDGYKWMTEMPIRLIKDVVAWMLFPNMLQPPKGAMENDL